MRVATRGPHVAALQMRWPALVAVASVAVWAVLQMPHFGQDAVTYLAAGERLNAGHALYSLTAGDRPVSLWPPYWTVPLVSPPLVAVLFRPIAVLGIRWVAVWCLTQALVLVWVVFAVVRGWPSALFVVALSAGIGLEAVAGNVAGYLAAGYFLVWRYRDRPWVGAIVGIMAVAKLFPIVLVGFLIARRHPRQIAAVGVGVLAALIIGILGAGLDSHWAYVGVLHDLRMQKGSLSDTFGLPWLSPAVLVAGTALAALLPERWAYRISIVTMFVGSPGIGIGTFCGLLPLPAASSATVTTAGSPRPRGRGHTTGAGVRPRSSATLST